MTGPEHYREAERLIREAVSQQPDQADVDAVVIAEAQVHATLALAAATAHAATEVANDGQTAGEWRRAITGPKVVNQ